MCYFLGQDSNSEGFFSSVFSQVGEDLGLTQAPQPQSPVEYEPVTSAMLEQEYGGGTNIPVTVSNEIAPINPPAGGGTQQASSTQAAPTVQVVYVPQSAPVTTPWLSQTTGGVKNQTLLLGGFAAISVVVLLVVMKKGR